MLYASKTQMYAGILFGCLFIGRSKCLSCCGRGRGKQMLWPQKNLLFVFGLLIICTIPFPFPCPSYHGPSAWALRTVPIQETHRTRTRDPKGQKTPLTRKHTHFSAALGLFHLSQEFTTEGTHPATFKHTKDTEYNVSNLHYAGRSE